MINIKYDQTSARGLIGNPHDRKPQAAAIMEKLGGRLIDFYFTFGTWDAVILVELPSEVHALAVVIADVAGGIRDTCVTPLYSMEEAINAMQLARSIDYRAPGHQ
ncbi:MAG: GYD domain-containing protein [Gammaproteobacteria bacterium]